MDQRKTKKMDILSESELAIVSTTILWKIKNFTAIPKKEWVRSSHFFIAGHSLHLKLRRSAACVYIYLRQEDIPNRIAGLHVVANLIDRQGKPRFIVIRRDVSIQESESMLHLMNITESSLGKPFNILTDDTLTIRCNISVEDEETVIETNKHISPEELENECEIGNITCLKTLSIDFGKYYDAHMVCDAVVKANGVDFPVHQAMLSARSPVLAEMLQQETSKCNVKTLDIPNVQPNILDNVLFYIYSGKVRGLTSDTATRSFAAADKFALLELKDICLKFIHNNLTVENIGDVALLAETQDNETLKEEVEKFITNNVTEVLQSGQWKEFTQQQYVLANAILTNVLLSSKQGC